MTSPAERLRTRLLPALLTAVGVTLLAAGLLTYSDPVLAEPRATASPSPTTAALATPSPLITLPPLATPGPTATATPTPSPNLDRLVTRVRIEAMDIDLPVIEHRTAKVPCNVAAYFDFDELSHPGQGRATYLFAHARPGMFLPLLEGSKVRNGRAMKGVVVEIWTNDDLRMLFEITEVRRHVPVAGGLDDPFAATDEELWLQTSEGPGVPAGQPRNPLLQVVAKSLSVEAADPADAHPKPKPVPC